MLIVCKQRRKDGSIHNVFGKDYHFQPTKGSKGEHVCEITDEDAITRFLSIKEGFHEFGKVTPSPKAVEPPAPKESDFTINNGENTVDLRSLSREQLIAFGKDELGVDLGKDRTQEQLVLDVIAEIKKPRGDDE